MLYLNSLLQKTSTIKGILSLLITSQIVFFTMMIFVFPVINSKIETKAFDLQTFGYSISTVNTILAKLDQETTSLYLFPQLSFLDVLYPFLLALFLSSFLYRLIDLTKSKLKVNALLLVLPFAAMSFDYLENICISLLITNSISANVFTVYLSSTFTVLKGLLTSIAWLAILLYSIKWWIHKYKKA